MKKFVTIFAVMLVAIMSLAAVAACGPNKNHVKAEDALKENGYSVSNVSISGLLWILASDIDMDKVDTTVSASKSIKNDEGEVEKIESLTIIYFKEAGDFFKDKVKPDVAWDELKAAIIEAENPDGERKDFVVAKSGNMIYYGTRAAIRAAM